MYKNYAYIKLNVKLLTVRSLGLAIWHVAALRFDPHGTINLTVSRMVADNPCGAERVHLELDCSFIFPLMIFIRRLLGRSIYPNPRSLRILAEFSRIDNIIAPQVHITSGSPSRAL